MCQNDLGCPCGSAPRRSSLVLVREAGKNHPSDQVTANVDGCKRDHAGGLLTVRSDLGERIAFVGGPTFVVVGIYGITVVRVVLIELVVHQGLIAVLKDGQVLELFQEDGDVVGGDEEASEEHEGDNEDGREGDGKLLVREGSRNNQ